MKLHFLIFLSVSQFILFGQDSIYTLSQVTELNDDFYVMQIILQSKTDSSASTKLSYFNNGNLNIEANYRSEKYNGKYKEWYENGQLKKEIDYKNGKINGQILTFWSNGKRKRVDTFENGNLVLGRCFDNYGYETIYIPYEIMPEFPGGISELMNYLAKHIKYPPEARQQGIQGRVFINFTVDADGSIVNINVIRGIGGGCDDEAVRVVEEMPKWKPGMVDGEKVRVSYNLPVKFTL